MKKNKYGNKKVKAFGLIFDSQKEYARYQELLLLQRAKAIENLQLQVSFTLVPSVKFSSEKRAKRAICYIADFVYWQDGKQIVEDVKSSFTRENPVYRIKKHLMMWVHGIEIREI